jgi:hypothetical protein
MQHSVKWTRRQQSSGENLTRKEFIQMKRTILVVVIVAVAIVFLIKRIAPKPHPATSRQSQSAAQASNEGRPILYLFHNPSDQDAGCRRIYSYADRAETELAGKVEVRRPDLEREKKLTQAYQVRVLPTILLVSPNGEVQDRFEGEDKATSTRIEQALERLKATPR